MSGGVKHARCEWEANNVEDQCPGEVEALAIPDFEGDMEEGG
jgi:hypothetical protein